MIKLSTSQLKIGMYVAVLDRPWEGTPFLFQSFLITSKKEIQQLQEFCHIVDIDENKSDPALKDEILSCQIQVDVLQDKEDVWQHVESHREKNNLKMARQVYESTTTSLYDILNDFRLNKPINPLQLKTCVRGVINGMMKNPDALALFSSLKSRQQDIVRHSLNVCILSLLFGRHLGFNEQQLSDLGYAALLHDVGEIKVRKAVLDKHNRGLTPEEKKEMVMHTKYGEKILLNTPNIPSIAIKVARSHHERVDGKGYPDGLKETEINYFARLVSIVDAYEIVIDHPNPHTYVSYSDALRSIYMMSGNFFDKKLVEEFMKCLGTYPIGSVVELNNSEIAIVISNKPSKHLLPVVMVIKYSKEGNKQPNIINLDNFREQVGLSKLYITKIIDPTSVGIDVSNYMIEEADIQHFQFKLDT
jgi:HD-GYP domain-containing protein (c-di-GMP phosphodiesterase class II)